MIRGIYFTARGMLAEQQRLDMTSNNLANAQTSGFKREFPLFASSGQVELWRTNDSPQFLSPVGQVVHPVAIGTMVTGSRLEGSLTDHGQGGMLETGRSLDLAVEGPGYFVVETPDGQRYTRNGAFLLDSEGYLVTSHGFRVVGVSGALKVDTSEISIDIEGNIRSGDAALGRLRVVEFPEPTGLIRQGDSLFSRSDESGDAREMAGGKVLQGYLEGSNVNALREVVDLITIMRSYESNQKALQAQDETLGKAIDQVARTY